MKPATPPWLLGRPDGPINLRIQPRSLIVGSLLLLACLLTGLLALRVGTLPLSSGQVFSALFGQASGAADIIVNQWRLPRAMMALIFGAALGISGAIFQSLVRNPLGSPDIIGFNAGLIPVHWWRLPCSTATILRLPVARWGEGCCLPSRCICWLIGRGFRVFG